MKKRISWFLLTILVFALLSTAYADERILDYHANITVHKDGSVQVHETICVRSEGDKIRHGIFRDFPTGYRSPLGFRKWVDLRVLDAREVGNSSRQFATENLTNGVRIKVGDPDTLIPPGDHTFELTYVVTQELGFFADHDELYWNVTGNGWAFPIDSVTADVSLPAPVEASNLKLAGYTGAMGSHQQNFTSEIAPDGTIRFTTTTPLQENEGLTVVLGFPKGLVPEPSLRTRISQSLVSNIGGPVAPAGLALVLLYFLVAWLLVGRDPKRGSIVIRYEPPDDISPAVLRYVKRRKFDNHMFGCTVLDLAVKGYISIKKQDKSYDLTRLRPLDDKLSIEERHLMQNLFVDTDSIKLDSANAETVENTLNTLKKDLKSEPKHKYAHSNFLWFIPGAALSIATFIAITYLALGDGSAIIGGIGLTVFTIPFLLIFRACLRSESGDRGGYYFLLLFFALIMGILLLALFWTVSIVIVFFFAAFILLNSLFFRLLNVISSEGRKLLDEIEGFRQFLVAVDADRLERLNLPDKTPELFEKFLPYALALGVEKQWSKQFANVLTNAAVTVGGVAGSYSPLWFSGDDLHDFSADHFTDSFGDSFSSAISSASSPPGSSSGFDFSSSDSSSSGSSGGGGGGGGGGGW